MNYFSKDKLRVNELANFILVYENSDNYNKDTFIDCFIESISNIINIDTTNNEILWKYFSHSEENDRLYYDLLMHFKMNDIILTISLYSDNNNYLNKKIATCIITIDPSIDENLNELFYGTGKIIQNKMFTYIKILNNFTRKQESLNNFYRERSSTYEL